MTAAAIVLAFLIAALLLVRESLFHGSFQPVSRLPNRRILDLHCHLAGIGAGNSGCRISPAMRSNVRFRVYLDAFGVTETELEDQGDALVARRLSEQIARSRRVGRAVVLALDGVIDSAGQLAS